MKPMKKSKFLSFCFSFVPGAGEMYMGFMKAGVSLMTIFVISVSLCAFLELPVLFFLPVVLWFYSFFRTNHLAGLSDEEFLQVEDEYVLGKELVTKGKANVVNYQKWLAGALIALGILLLWNVTIDLLISWMPDYMRRLVWTIRSTVPQVIIGILVIAIGIKMIQGKKRVLFETENEEQQLQTLIDDSREG